MVPADPVVDDFARWHVESGDVDPVYPVLADVLDHLELDLPDRVAFVLLYVAYYSLPSALQAWLEGWRPGKELTDAQLRYTTGVERRAHRDVRQFARHMQSLNEHWELLDGAGAYFVPPVPGPARRWTILQSRLAQVHGNGRWAGYKTGEIFDTVLGLDCPPPDAGHAYSSGPRKGIADIFPGCDPGGNGPRVVALLDRYTDELVARWGLPVAQVETILCDWHSVVNGHYYVGHDIDLLQSHIARCEHRTTRRMLGLARLASFDERWLGELQGWDGVRKPLKSLYVDEGRIDWWT